MHKIVSLGLLFLVIFTAKGQQEVRLPADLRQHNLTTYNASLFNPAFSLDQNNPQSLSLWTRWQWQSIDGDPSTIFLNYTRKLDQKSAVGAAFFQHNTGVFFNTGGVVNYARTVELSPLIRLSYGANLFGFQQKLADTRFPIDPDTQLPQQQITQDFILQFAPGISLYVENFAFSLASENLLDYNFTSKESNTLAADKIFMGMVSYDFPITMGSDSTAFLRPSLYLRTIPALDNQVGFSTLLSTWKYWGQLGYNNFYGISVGAGGTFFNKMSLGALVEFGTSASLNSKDPSFEIVASYFLGKPDERRKPVGFDLPDQVTDITTKEVEKKIDKPEEIEPQPIQDDKQDKEAKKLERKEAKKQADLEKALAKEKRRDSITAAKEEKQVLEEAKKLEEERANAIVQQPKEDEVLEAERKLREQQVLDSINNVRENAEQEAIARLEQERKLDSISKAKLAEEEVVKPEAGEKYEEVATEDGLEPGYYLIANVFGTKKYFEAFMKDLSNKGIEPGAFLRSTNKYNYVYLKRYNTMAEARKARDSKFGGRYPDKTWIFRVVGK